MKAGARDGRDHASHVLDYNLQRWEPDEVILRRQDGSFVAAFGARGAPKEDILEAAKAGRRELTRAHTNLHIPEAVIVAPVR